MLQVDGENLPGGDVIAVGEAAGDRHNLILQQQLGIVTQPLNVQPIDIRAGPLERELGFVIAVGAGGAKNENARVRHDETSLMADVSGRISSRAKRRDGNHEETGFVEYDLRVRGVAVRGLSNNINSQLIIYEWLVIGAVLFHENISQVVDYESMSFIYLLYVDDVNVTGSRGRRGFFRRSLTT